MPARNLITAALLIALLPACTPSRSDIPIRPVEPPVPQATAGEVVVTLIPRDALPPTPTAVAWQPPSATPTAAAWEILPPTPTPISAQPGAGANSGSPVNLSPYLISAEMVYSLDGAWAVEALRGEIRAGDPNPPGADYYRITAENFATGLRWVFEEQPAHTGPTEGEPAGFTFSADGNWLYFYNHVRISGTCTTEYNHTLRRMDLRSGKVEAIPGYANVTHFTLAPDASRAARVVGTDLLVTDFTGGAEKAIPLTLPEGEDAGVSAVLWSPDSRQIALNYTAGMRGCENRPIFLSTHIVDVAAGTIQRLDSPENVVGAMYWSAPGVVVVQTGRDAPSAVNVETLAGVPFVIAPETLAAQRAQAGLRDYLKSIYLSTFDHEETGLAHAQQAVEKYAGDWGLLSSRYPSVRFASQAAMLRYACQQGDLRCGAVRQVQLAEIFGEDRFSFEVQFLDQTGSIVTAGGQDRFRFVVQSRWPEPVKVDNLPPMKD